MPSLTRSGEVFMLDLGDTENRFHPNWLAEVATLLDQLVLTTGPRALVTAGTGKFFSNGLDTDWMGRHPERFAGYADDVHALLSRVLTLPVPTVAAVQGHAFGAGAMLALAHDSRVMRADRGFWCLPEVSIGLPFSPGMVALIQSRLPPQAAHEAMTTGRRYGGVDAQAAGIVEQLAAEDEVRAAAVARAAALAGTAGETLGVIKQRMYQEVLRLLRAGGLG